VSRLVTIAVVATAFLAGIGAAVAVAQGDGPTVLAVFPEEDPYPSFRPASVTIAAGQTVTWRNDLGLHNVHFLDEQFRMPETPDSSAWTVARTFTAAGTYAYVCDAHAQYGMTGTVVVTGAGTTPEITPMTPESTTSPASVPERVVQGPPLTSPPASGPSRHPRITYRFVHLWAWDDTGTWPVSVRLSLNRPRTTVRVICRGRGCPFRVRARTIRRRRVDVAPWFGAAVMTPGTRVTILMLKRGFIGQALQFRIRQEAVPSVTRRCVPPGSRRPARRCR
jgi:plastocyanin